MHLKRCNNFTWSEICWLCDTNTCMCYLYGIDSVLFFTRSTKEMHSVDWPNSLSNSKRCQMIFPQRMHLVSCGHLIIVWFIHKEKEEKKKRANGSLLKNEIESRLDFEICKMRIWQKKKMFVLYFTTWSNERWASFLLCMSRFVFRFANPITISDFEVK